MAIFNHRTPAPNQRSPPPDISPPPRHTPTPHLQHTPTCSPPPRHNTSIFPLSPPQAEQIARDATDPGAAIVIGSGQKLPPQRPLNEVLGADPSASGFKGPILVPQGELDPLSGAQRAQDRAEVFRVLRPGVTVVRIAAGHCPHDEVPEQVAAAIKDWLPQVR
jgi:pimeloyl-ACP methyl ester carboxylesterase